MASFVSSTASFTCYWLSTSLPFITITCQFWHCTAMCLKLRNLKHFIWLLCFPISYRSIPFILGLVGALFLFSFWWSTLLSSTLVILPCLVRLSSQPPPLPGPTNLILLTCVLNIILYVATPPSKQTEWPPPRNHASVAL